MLKKWSKPPKKRATPKEFPSQLSIFKSNKRKTERQTTHNQSNSTSSYYNTVKMEDDEEKKEEGKEHQTTLTLFDKKPVTTFRRME